MLPLITLLPMVVLLVGVYVLTLVIEILLEFVTGSRIKHGWNFFTIAILKFVRYALCYGNFAELGV